MKFIPLGYGKETEVLKRLPDGNFFIIRDDDAASTGMPDCWFAIETTDFKNADFVKKQYIENGGTVSFMMWFSQAILK